jgi:hypothetical protein
MLVSIANGSIQIEGSMKLQATIILFFLTLSTFQSKATDPIFTCGPGYREVPPPEDWPNSETIFCEPDGSSGGYVFAGISTIILRGGGIGGITSGLSGGDTGSTNSVSDNSENSGETSCSGETNPID